MIAFTLLIAAFLLIWFVLTRVISLWIDTKVIPFWHDRHRRRAIRLLVETGVVTHDQAVARVDAVRKRKQDGNRYHP